MYTGWESLSTKTIVTFLSTTANILLQQTVSFVASCRHVLHFFSKSGYSQDQTKSRNKRTRSDTRPQDQSELPPLRPDSPVSEPSGTWPSPARGGSRARAESSPRSPPCAGSRRSWAPPRPCCSPGWPGGWRGSAGCRLHGGLPPHLLSRTWGGGREEGCGYVRREGGKEGGREGEI